MSRKPMTYLIYFLIGLATFGFITMLIKNPSGLFMSLLLTLVIAFVLFKVLSYVLKQRQGGGNSEEMKKYQQAVKQSKAKYQAQTKAPVKKKETSLRKSKRRRRKHAPHLRVIDGKKNQDKNDRVL